MSMRHNFLATCLVLAACGGDDGDSDTNVDPSTSGSATMTGGNTLTTTEDPSSESGETIDPSATDPTTDTTDTADSSSSDTIDPADSSSSGNPVGPDCSLGDGPDFSVTASSNADYTIDGAADPALTVVRGCSYTFDVNASNHPFLIKTVQGVGVANVYETGVTGNGVEMGQLTWDVAADAPDTLFYNCENHGMMTNTITVISGE